MPIYRVGGLKIHYGCSSARKIADILLSHRPLLPDRHIVQDAENLLATRAVRLRDKLIVCENIRRGP